MRVALVSDDSSPLAVLGETEVSGRHTYIAGLARALAVRGHAHTWRSGAAAMDASRVAGAPVIQTLHELSGGDDGDDPPDQAPTESRLIREVDHVVTTRPSVAAELIRRGARHDRVTTVAGGVDTDLFSPHGSGWEVEGRRRLVCLGELVERKQLDVDGQAEFVDDGSTGLFVASADPDELVAAIRRVLDDDALSERLGEQGRRRAVAQYDWKQVAERVEATYDDAINARSAAVAAS